MTIKIATIVGARPQFIKSSILSREFQKHKSIKEYIIHTGQHFDFNMSKIFYDELKLKKPFINLKINKNTNLGNISKTMINLEKLLLKLRINIVVIFGDTDSTISGAITAAKLNIPIIHIEAGLRCFDLSMPEEQNRVVSDHLSRFLITPTDISTKNLINEGINKNKIFQFGDIMLDAWNFFHKKLNTKDPIFVENKLVKNEYVLMTVHRHNNTMSNLYFKKILNSLKELKITVLFPIHPRTEKLISGTKLKIPKNIKIIKPVGYLQMILLLANCKYIITDSGGLQKEAYFAKKNSFVLRQSTEWKELITNKHAILLNKNFEQLKTKFKFNTNFNKNYYGNGKTSKKITKLILDYYEKKIL